MSYWWERRYGAWWEFDPDRRISYYKFLRAVYRMEALSAWDRVNNHHPDDWKEPEETNRSNK